jgi:hypothetical protein
LERARDREGGSRTAWCADYRGGGGGSYRSQISLPSRPKYAKMVKNSQVFFAHFLVKKSPKTPFFTHKYLTRCNPKTFFEEYPYINFKIFTT